MEGLDRGGERVADEGAGLGVWYFGGVGERRGCEDAGCESEGGGSREGGEGGA